jgi:hypothetical protein
MAVEVLPKDEHNSRLVANVHPPGLDQPGTGPPVQPGSDRCRHGRAGHGRRCRRAGRHDQRDGVAVNDRLQTTNPSIYAAGDVRSRFKFTHAADAMARIVLQNALFKGRARASALTIPWCTYTDPEIAHFGEGWRRG